MNAKTLILIFTLFCSNLFASNTVARVTYYWGCKNTSTGNRPVSGKTIAVDPKLFLMDQRSLSHKWDKLL